MKYFDLHCDTATFCRDIKIPLAGEGSALFGYDKCGFSRYTQLFALYIDDRFKGESAYDALVNYAAFLRTELENTDFQSFESCPEAGRSYIISLENSAPLCGRLERIDRLYELGVRAATLTWNDRNCLGSGSLHNEPLTDFGKAAVKRYDEVGITIDISHLSDKGVRDVFSLCETPVIASHSNLRSVCNHRRNLTDAQFCEVARRGGLVGINLYSPFLTERGEAAVDDALRHANKMLELGGENAVCIGADLDGAAMPEFFMDISYAQSLYEAFQESFGTALADRIFYGNSERFFKEKFKTGS